MKEKCDKVRAIQEQSKKVAILFSGGRDSSLAACLLALSGYKIYLLSFYSGLGIKSDISNYRFQELRERFPENIVDRVVLPTFGLVRRIAIVNIENDFARFKVNLILLGEKLAMNTAATVFCLSHNIRVLADGSSGYQQNLAEQLPEALALFRNFHSEYGIEYQTPIASFRSEDEVKYLLMEMGISTKSLEGISIFADSFSQPSPEIVKSYLEEKIPVCREHIKLMLPSIDGSKDVHP